MVKNRARLILDLIIGFGIIFALFALYAFNYWNGDREAYETYYQTRSLGDWGVEVIYGFLSIAFRALGANYQAFNAAIAALSLLLVARFLLKSPGNLTMPAIAFAIAAFPLDYVLARYFLSSAIILNALLFLENDDDDHRYIKFILSILIATMTHQSSIIFSIFIFAGPRKSNYLILIKIICSISALYALLRLQFDLPDLIHRHLSYYKTTIKTAIIYSLMHCAVVAVFIFATHIVSNRREFRFFHVFSPYFRWINLITQFNILSLAWIVTYFESTIFVRPMRFVIILNMIFLSKIAFDKNLSRSGKVVIAGTAFALAVFLFVYFIYPYRAYTVEPLIYCNAIFGPDCRYTE